jgi:hypothetical protein
MHDLAGRLFAMGLSSLALVAALPAAAQFTKSVIAAPADQPYRFRHSGLTIPASLDGMRRVAIEQIGGSELDVFANYQRGSEAVTIYVFRMASGAAPVWFDRARTILEARRDVYGTITPILPPTAFTPPGQGVASGLIAGWSVSRPPYRGTVLAMVPLGEWLVKVRYSSTTLDGAGIAARMPAVLAALTWPTEFAAPVPAKPVADCLTPLAFPTTAKVQRDPKMLSVAAFTGGLLAVGRALKDKPKPGVAAVPPKPVIWCRDPATGPAGGVYREDASTDSYLLAISDSGRAALVQPDPATGRIAKTNLPGWSVNLIDVGNVLVYPPFTALPRPRQVMDALRRPAMAHVPNWGNDTNRITINPNALGEKR